MPFIVVEADSPLADSAKEAIRTELTQVFARLNTDPEVTAVAVSCPEGGSSSSGGASEACSLRIVTAMQPRPAETVAELERGFAAAADKLGLDLAESRFIQVSKEDWPHPRWAR